jgi:hypothetical protein
MQPALAAVVGDVLFRGEGVAPPAVAEGSAPAVEFVPVPGLASDRRGGRGDPGARGLPPKAGAGLETDLGDVPHGDRLPREVRAALPPCGVVNYMEAAAVVRTLEKLAARAGGGAHSLAVVALSAAQAELIRLLAERSPALAAGPAVRVDVPAGFREEEFDTVLVSLTRSHAHRAVPFGEGPALLALALTRARRRLVVFGDAGTLARRGQWAGPVDHLDEPAAARERDIVARLLEYIYGRGPHREAFAVAEGSAS